MMLNAVAAILALASAAAEQSQEPYDLFCKGIVASVSADSQDGALGAPETPWSQTYRVNAPANEWCEDKCSEIEHFVIGENKLWLKVISSKDGQKADAGKIDSLWVNRRTGVLVGISGETDPQGNWAGLRFITSGSCVRQPFTEFPKPAF